MIANIGIMTNAIHFNHIASKYIMEHGVPVMGMDENGYYFAKTKLLADVLKNAPLWIKVLLNFNKIK
jgi:CRISPR/Cas system-associated endonuclease Cas1